MNTIGFSKDMHDAAWELFRVDVNSIKGHGGAQSQQDRKVHVLLQDLEGLVNEISHDTPEITGVNPQTLMKLARELKNYTRGEDANRLHAITVRLMNILSPQNNEEVKPMNIQAIVRQEGALNPYASEVEGLTQGVAKWLEKNAPSLSYEYFLAKCQSGNLEKICNAFQLFRKMEKNPDQISDKALLILATQYVDFQKSAAIVKNLPRIGECFTPCSSNVFAETALKVVPEAQNKRILGLSDTEEDFCVYAAKKEGMDQKVLQTFPAISAVLEDNTLISNDKLRPYLALIKYKVMSEYKDQILLRPLTPQEVAHYFEASRFLTAHKGDPILQKYLENAMIDDGDPFTDEIFQKIAASAEILGEDEVGVRLPEGQGALRYSPSGKKLVVTIRDPDLHKLRSIKIDRENMKHYVLDYDLVVVKKDA